MKCKTFSCNLFSYRLSPIYLKLKDAYHRYRPISAKYCKHTDENLFVTQAYLTYLQSTRKRKTLQSIYSKGERSVEQAANIVGLKLPKTIDRPHLPLNEASD